MAKSLSIVIPCYNEQDAVFNVLSSIEVMRDSLTEQYGLSEVQVIVVNDCSTDNSLNEIRKFDYVEIISNDKNVGYGASLNIGFERARGECICFLDMDGTYPIRELPNMWDIMHTENADVVYGQRSFVDQGMSFTRGFGNWFYTSLAKALFGSKIQDTCTGYRLFKQHCVPVYLKIQEGSLAYSIEMTILNILNGFKTIDHKINYAPRTGDSKLTVWRDGWTFLARILSAAARHHSSRVARPFISRSLKLSKPNMKYRSASEENLEPLNSNSSSLM